MDTILVVLAFLARKVRDLEVTRYDLFEMLRESSASCEVAARLVSLPLRRLGDHIDIVRNLAGVALDNADAITNALRREKDNIRVLEGMVCDGNNTRKVGAQLRESLDRAGFLAILDYELKRELSLAKG